MLSCSLSNYKVQTYSKTKIDNPKQIFGSRTCVPIFYVDAFLVTGEKFVRHHQRYLSI